jgi:hypothetical protein
MITTTNAATTARRPTPWRSALAGVAAAALLAACGGDDAPPLQATAQRSAAATTLLDDLGQPMPPDGTTTTNDSAVRALGVRLASRQQADQLQAALPDETISVDAGCCGTEAADIAVLMVWGEQAARNLDRAAPVLVRGADQRLAATVARRLADAGMSRVWVVGP